MKLLWLQPRKLFGSLSSKAKGLTQDTSFMTYSWFHPCFLINIFIVLYVLMAFHCSACILTHFSSCDLERGAEVIWCTVWMTWTKSIESEDSVALCIVIRHVSNISYMIKKRNCGWYVICACILYSQMLPTHPHNGAQLLQQRTSADGKHSIPLFCQKQSPLLIRHRKPKRAKARVVESYQSATTTRWQILEWCWLQNAT